MKKGNWLNSSTYLSRRARKPKLKAICPGIMPIHWLSMSLRKIHCTNTQCRRHLGPLGKEISHCHLLCISLPSTLAKDQFLPMLPSAVAHFQIYLAWRVSQSPGHSPAPWPQRNRRYAFSAFYIGKVSLKYGKSPKGWVTTNACSKIGRSLTIWCIQSSITVWKQKQNQKSIGSDYQCHADLPKHDLITILC